MKANRHKSINWEHLSRAEPEGCFGLIWSKCHCCLCHSPTPCQRAQFMAPSPSPWLHLSVMLKITCGVHFLPMSTGPPHPVQGHLSESPARTLTTSPGAGVDTWPQPTDQLILSAGRGDPARDGHTPPTVQSERMLRLV